MEVGMFEARLRPNFFQRLLVVACVLAGMFAFLSWEQTVVASITDGRALSMATKNWGPAAMVEKVWKGTTITTRVGFASPGCKDALTAVGEGISTWDDAFAKVPANKNVFGPVSGTYALTVDTSTPAGDDKVYGTVTSVRAMVDGALTGEPVATSGDKLFKVSIPLAKVADGYHVVCAQLLHSDGSFAMTHASMFIVKQ